MAAPNPPLRIPINGNFPPAFKTSPVRFMPIHLIPPIKKSLLNAIE
jgi:hypothetical protein